MKSMTGYGKGVYETGGRKFTVELKSVNHRFLDINIRAPKTLGFCEHEVRKCLSQAFFRGHIEVFVNYEDNRAGQKEINIDFGVAEKYMRAGAELESKYMLINDLTASTILRLPDIVTERDSDLDEALMSRMLKVAVDNACLALSDMRTREGEELKADIESKLDKLIFLMDDAEKRAPQVAVDYRERLASKMSEILSGVGVDEYKLINEIAFFAEHSAVDEELSRLASHITQFLGLLTKNVAVGKEMDFLMQEINREINTIGSKANDKELTALVIEMKAEAEKIREQVQNVE